MGKNRRRKKAPKQRGLYNKTTTWPRALKETAAARGLLGVLLPAGVADAHALFGKIAKSVSALVPGVHPRRLRRASGTDRGSITRTLGIKGDAPIPESDIARVYIKAIQQPVPKYANAGVCEICMSGPADYWGDGCCAHCSDTCSCPKEDQSGNYIDEPCMCYQQVDGYDNVLSIGRGIGAKPNHEQ
tara:strand:- start:2014 stop:2574 length:561 start_codon:yes stop_codon:yes gene_type:complete